MTDILLETIAGKTAVLCLNRPEARNSLSLDMLDALHKAIDRLGQDVRVHVIIIKANGPAFCAGHDLKELAAARAGPDKGAAFFEQTMKACAALMLSIVNCPKPVIAQVGAMATAAGCQLVATCDLAIASDTAKFATPGVNIGLFCSTPMVALSRNVSRKKALEMLLTGEPVSAHDAMQHGLVNQICSADELENACLELAEKIAAKAPKTVRLGKAAFYRQAEMPLADAYEFTAAVMVQNMMADDAVEGIDAFLGKRNPEWTPLS